MLESFPAINCGTILFGVQAYRVFVRMIRRSKVLVDVGKKGKMLALLAPLFGKDLNAESVHSDALMAYVYVKGQKSGSIAY